MMGALKFTLGEGNTSVREIDGLKLKLEYENPTHSFKDRGTASMVSELLKKGVKRAMIDSSGNAGLSLATYGKAAGIEIEVFISSRIPKSKKSKLQNSGAKLIEIDGDRTKVGKEARRYRDETGIYYASHIFEESFHKGVASYFLELSEEDFQRPIYLPVGNGTFLFGLMHAVRKLGRKWPEVVIVQPENSSSLLGTEGQTMADAVNIPKPPRIEDLRRFAAISRTEFVSEEEILRAFDYLKQNGIQAEFTAAMTFAAALRDKNPASLPICAGGSDDQLE